MQDVIIKKPKKAASPVIFGILSMVFAFSAVFLGGAGLVGKVAELILAGPAFVLFGMLMMTYLGIIIGILIWIPVVNVIFVALVDILLIFMSACAIGAELIPVVLAGASIIMAIIAIAKGISKDRYGVIPMGMVSIVVSIITPVVFIIPAIISIIAKLIINISGIVSFTGILIDVLQQAPLG